MARVTFVQAVRNALAEEMRRDPTTFLLGEDVQTGVLGTTRSLVDEFGPDRVRNCPISEAGFVGVGVGAAVVGSRPIVDLTYATFSYLAMDQLVNQAAKLRYMTGGQVRLSVTYIAMSGAGHQGSAQHSESPHGMLMNVPGLKVVMPSGPREAKGLLKAAIRDDNPVFMFMDFNLLRLRGEVPEDPDFTIPIGHAEVKREGEHVSIAAIGPALPRALEAAESLAKGGIEAEVIDVLSLAPLDVDTIVRSVAKTRRLVIVDDAPPIAGAAAEISALIAERCFRKLAAPPRRVCRLGVPMPFNAKLEHQVMPSVARIVSNVESTVREQAA